MMIENDRALRQPTDGATKGGLSARDAPASALALALTPAPVAGLALILILLCAACTSDFDPGFDAGAPDGHSGWDELGLPIGPNRPTCPGQETNLTGTVLAPNGQDPVPGATVFIPSKVPELFPPEVACEACAQLGTDHNHWWTTSSFDGTFELKGVCPGRRMVVFQNGRFRRMIEVVVPAAATMALPAAQTRLPTRSGEMHVGDSVPRIAVATGDYDKMECVLRKIGLADGTYDFFEGATYLKAASALPTFASLVSDLTKMKSYNIIFINCTNNTWEKELAKPAVRQNLDAYVQAGGRLYVTDWSYDWIEQVEGFAPFIDFEPGPSGAEPEPLDAAALGKGEIKVQATIKDAMMRQWLALFPNTVQGDKAPIEHFLAQWVIMHQVNKEVKLWVEGPIQSISGTINGTRPLTVTFNFKNCGKILYTSYHTEGRDEELLAYPAPAKPFPQYCGAGASPQDRILEYLIFDIANCIKPID